MGEYIDKARDIYNTNTPWHFRGKNFQAYELGLNTDEITTKRQRHSAVKQVKGQFDLIMVTEYYWESLIMMKDLLCMDWYDLYIDARTVGSYEKPTFSEDEKEKFSKFNQLDEDLYKMSNSTFWEKAGKRKGGTQKLAQDVQNLKALYRYRDENVQLCKSIKNKKISKYDDNYLSTDFETDSAFET